MNKLISSTAAVLVLLAANTAAQAQPMTGNPQVREASPDATSVDPSPKMPSAREGRVIERMPNGELSTVVNGRPNAQPNMPAPDTRTMGAPMHPMAHGPAAAQGRGTPD